MALIFCTPFVAGFGPVVPTLDTRTSYVDPDEACIADGKACAITSPSGPTGDCGKYIEVNQSNFCYYKKSTKGTCDYFLSGCESDPTSKQCQDYDRYVDSGMCPPHTPSATVIPFCFAAFNPELTTAKLVLPEGTWCSTVGEDDCSNAVLSSPSYGAADETLYQECFWDKNKNKCQKVKNSGYDVVHICSNSCQELTGRSEVDDDDATCNTGSGNIERLTDMDTCESAFYSREQAAGGASWFPCKYQGEVDGVKNPNCHPDYFGPAAGCNCVAMNPCQEEAFISCCKQEGDDYLCYDCDTVA